MKLKEKINKNRRNFLKVLFLVLGFVILNKLISLLNIGKKEKREEIEIGEFRAINAGREVIFFNKKGEKVFTLTQEGELIIGD